MKKRLLPLSLQLVLLIGCSSQTPTPQAAAPRLKTEHLSIAVPRGWRVSPEDSTDMGDSDLEITTLSPERLSPEMVSEQFIQTTFLGRGDRERNSEKLPIRDLYQEATQRHRLSCPSGEVSPILAQGDEYGFPFLVWQQLCPRDLGAPPSGSLTFLKAVQGSDNAYLLQRIWRTPPYRRGAIPVRPSEIAVWGALLRSAHIERPTESSPDSPQELHAPLPPPADIPSSSSSLTPIDGAPTEQGLEITQPEPPRSEAASEADGVPPTPDGQVQDDSR